MIPSAVAKNIQTMLVARFFDGLFGSVFLSVAGGTVGDLFVKTELQAPMMVYTCSPFVGPEVGPLIGGYINQYTTWSDLKRADSKAKLPLLTVPRRWSFYVLIAWSGTMLLLIIAVPETYHPVLLRRKAESLRRGTGDEQWWAPIEKLDRSITQTILWSLIRPFQLLILEPMCLNLCLFSAFLLGVLYLFFGAFAVIFPNTYGFQLHQVGLSFLGITIGMILGTATDPFWHRNYQRLVRQREARGGEPGGTEPEYRLPPAIVGAVLVPIGLFFFGWTTYPSVHWVVPIIGSALFGMG